MRVTSFFIIWLCFIVAARFPCSQLNPEQKTEALLRPDPGWIEQSLVALINEEREKEGLPALSVTSELATLARKHSEDMASRNLLSHLSSLQESYQDRLVREGFFFGHIGENVARSETFVPQWIHQSLMDSPEHRENILDLRFDQVGVGVFEREKAGYFVTQDFIQSLEMMTVEEARQLILSKIQDIRRGHNLPPIVIREDVNQIAQLFASARAAGQDPPPFPEGLGETLVLFLTTPFLKDLRQSEDHLQQAKYAEGGVGVEFHRTISHPGGAYFIALMFSPAPSSPGPRPSPVELVLSTINRVRLESGLASLRLEKSLSRLASRIGSALLKQRSSPLSSMELHINHLRLCYLTERLEILPKSIEAKILDPRLKKIGLDISSFVSADFPRRTYLVIIVLE